MSAPLIEKLKGINESLSSAISDLEAVTATEPKVEMLKILSWNIMGPKKKGDVDIRKVLVPIVIGKINPHVMLLQEVESNLILKHIASMCSLKCNRSYECELETGGIPYEAKVLYDCDVFTSVRKIVLWQKEGACKPDWPTTTLTNDQAKELNERVEIFELQHKDKKKPIIFVSFHNKNTDESQELADRFAETMSEIADGNDLVVAGADLNCGDFSSDLVDIPSYEETARRISKQKIDYFILASPESVQWKRYVEAVNIIPDTNPRSKEAYSRKQYNSALDHDPLVCKLDITSV